MFNLVKGHYHKNPFIGLFLKTNDTHTLLPKRAPGAIKIAAEALKTEQVEMFINQSPLIGLFSVFNSNGCVFCYGAEPEEKKLLKKHGYNVCQLQNSLAPGNMFMANDKAVLLGGMVSKASVKHVADCLGVEAFQIPLTMHTPGSLNVVTNKGLLAYNDIPEVEYKQLKKIFGVEGTNGTVNGGSVFNALGVIANRHGAIVGENTTGYETQRVYEALSGE
ncbi:translation initiation factor IF-6 [Candidatus Micrarchaeota archaeon]|nr:translation initiation factor IF-6 [Candidatus Micrarchaeota archaeon]